MEKKLSPASVVKPMLVDPSVNFTHPFRELTFPVRFCPLRAPSTNVRFAPRASGPETEADVRPRAKRIRVWAEISEKEAKRIKATPAKISFFVFITPSKSLHEMRAYQI